MSNTDLYNDIVGYADITGTCNDRIGAGRGSFGNYAGLTFMATPTLQGLTGVTAS